MMAYLASLRGDFAQRFGGLQDKLCCRNPEGEVCAALAAYKWALIETNYRSLWHRLLCSAGDKVAISNAAALDRAEKHAQQVVSKTPEHRAALERIVRQQPEDVARKDRFFDLLKTTFES